MFRRLSVLGTLLLAACTPQGPGVTLSALANCYSNAPSDAEASAWREARRADTAKAYRSFVKKYPGSCYVPIATARLSRVVEKKPAVVRNLPRQQTGVVSNTGGY